MDYWVLLDIARLQSPIFIPLSINSCGVPMFAILASNSYMYTILQYSVIKEREREASTKTKSQTMHKV